MPEDKTSLNLTPEQEQLNADVMQGKAKPKSVDEYIRLSQERGVLPADISPEKRAEIEATFKKLNQG
jgi:hypothetical protein